VRKLLKTLLSLLIMAPAAALALGLGNVTLHSALNEPLNADIELLSVAPGELESLQVALADAQTFARLGVERDANLMFLRFELSGQNSDRPLIRVTSREVMREPFLSFLVEARWSTGRLVREYTLLLDPPVNYAELTPPPVAAPAVAPTVSPVTPASRPAVGAAPRPAASAAPAARAPATVAPAAPGELVYGPVRNDDTLWRIAQQMRPSDDITIQQMMMALLQANPHAFVDGNINRLKAGYVLRIDDPALLRAMSQAEAAREVSRQTTAWQQRRQAVAERAAERVTPESSAAAPAAVAAAPSREPELKLVSPEGRADSPAGSDEAVDKETAAAVRQDLMLALESSAAQRQENQELLKRIAAMEAQLTDMERILNLKSSDLAVLQQQLREQGQDVAELPSEQAAPAETAPAETVTEAPAAEVLPEVSVAEPEVAAPPVAAAPAERPRRVVPPPPPPEPTLLESLMADTTMLALAAVVLLVLLILAMLVIRRRRKDAFQESILSGGTSSMLAAKASEGGETSFLSDLAISGMGQAATHGEEGEVDPLTEADVFMAYGRNQQAEEVLKNALIETPDRHELTAKLLEVYYSTRNATAFAALAASSAAALQAKEEIWSKVVAMGHELLPEDEMFAGADSAEVAPVASKSTSSMSDDVLDIGLDLDELSAEMEGEAEGSDDLLNLDLDMFDAEDKPAEMSPPAAAASDEFDLDLDLDLDEQAASPAAEPQDTDAAADEFSLDMDLADEQVGEPSLASAEPTQASDEFSLDFDLGGDAADAATTESEFDMELGDLDLGDLGPEDNAPAPSTETTDALGDLELDDADMDALNLDELGGLDDLDEGMLDDADEITTKLDLAQAYIEMGDAEGARSMLEEVVEAGNEEQKSQAQELLNKI